MGKLNPRKTIIIITNLINWQTQNLHVVTVMEIKHAHNRLPDSTVCWLPAHRHDNTTPLWDIQKVPPIIMFTISTYMYNVDTQEYTSGEMLVPKC